MKKAKNRINLNPHKIATNKANNLKDAWWYEETTGITIVAEVVGVGPVIVGKIGRKILADYLRRSET